MVDRFEFEQALVINIDVIFTYEPYVRMSGFQIMLVGRAIFSMPPYSAGSHDSRASFQDCSQQHQIPTLTISIISARDFAEKYNERVAWR